MNDRKLNGSYYTPSGLAELVIDKIMQRGVQPHSLQILEPSCGDGVFVKQLLHSLQTYEGKISIDAVEKDAGEILKVDIFDSRPENINLNLFVADFITYQKNIYNKYDLIVGNPPYIAARNMEITQIENCREALKESGIDPRCMKNIWTAFVISATKMLTSNGVLSFVLPSDIFNVQYSSEIRMFLEETFPYIEILFFKELVFTGIQQDVIVFTGWKRATENGTRCFQVDKLDGTGSSTREISFFQHKVRDDNYGNWNYHVLTEQDLELLHRVKDGMGVVKDYCDIQVGIVTGANDYFIVKPEVIEEYNMSSHTKDIILKSSLTPNSLILNSSDMDLLKQSGQPCQLLSIDLRGAEQLEVGIKKYLHLGCYQGIDQKYKCNKRELWYSVPSVWASEGMFFRRINLYPKLLINESRVLVTDSAYRISMKPGYDIGSFVFSFYNSLSFVMAELGGRFYGGGVLELTPSEFRSLHTPYFEIEREYVLRLDAMIRSKKQMTEILNFTDGVILKGKLGLTEHEILSIRNMHNTLVTRRKKLSISTFGNGAESNQSHF